ncbi:MAG: hypothetical protein ABIH21_01895 [Patescibacteria group bacterium]
MLKAIRRFFFELWHPKNTPFTIIFGVCLLLEIVFIGSLLVVGPQDRDAALALNFIHLFGLPAVLFLTAMILTTATQIRRKISRWIDSILENERESARETILQAWKADLIKCLTDNDRGLKTFSDDPTGIKTGISSAYTHAELQTYVIELLRRLDAVARDNAHELHRAQLHTRNFRDALERLLTFAIDANCMILDKLDPAKGVTGQELSRVRVKLGCGIVQAFAQAISATTDEGMSGNEAVQMIEKTFCQSIEIRRAFGKTATALLALSRKRRLGCNIHPDLEKFFMVLVGEEAMEREDAILEEPISLEQTPPAP